ncbi:hypothetical protein [Stackebrandtia nassauensis]|uniref:Uncharacterized protein n=1 Tax=Stackebrandtia nassauensis (strain DSM 44728 / CIP 108903 / NRRL B-16338 / NBRC 102104 / LLR-40K-21) TaxID=446470 RepID=D3QBF4_STANL|nr:hypothetical protein [Stackebrandtia nassauensis]ADD42836.1 hypothetical protein Snas_3165 [Stackebrandtia nassauensis DSM 44728]
MQRTFNRHTVVSQARGKTSKDCDRTAALAVIVTRAVLLGALAVLALAVTLD